MSKIHIVVGDNAALNLRSALAENEHFSGEIMVLKDILHIGPLQDEENNPFSNVRSSFWNEVSGNNSNEIVVDDLERLMQVSSRLSNDEALQLWFWMAPWPADVCAYFWLLHYLKKHTGRLYVVNINGLPFLDEEGKLYYPDNISQLPVKEIIKAQKLARQISPSEWETDGDEWSKLATDNAGIRLFSGGKKITNASIDYYDEQLLKLCTQQNQKITRVINNLFSKHKNPAGDTFMLWRLQQLANDGKVIMDKSDVRLGNTAEVMEDNNDGYNASPE